MLVFVGVPLLELFVVLQVGAAIGGWWTAGLLILDSILGALLLRYEGRRAWSEFRQALAAGRWPGDEVAQGALIIVGGTLLVTPGFVTDVVGFLLLLAPSRRVVARGVRHRMEAGVAAGVGSSSGQRTGGRSRRPNRGTPRPGTTEGLDVEVVEIRREQPPDRPHLADDGFEPDPDER